MEPKKRIIDILSSSDNTFEKEDEWSFLDNDDLLEIKKAFDENNAKSPVTSKKQSPSKPTRKASRSASYDKWGLAGIKFTQIPNLLLDSKQRLELKDGELIVLLHLIKHWWSGDEQRPYPSKSKLAEVAGKDLRQIQRILKNLETNDVPVRNKWAEEPGYIERIPRHAESGRQRSNEFDLSKLKVALNCLVLEIENAKSDLKKRGPSKAPQTKQNPSRSQMELKRKKLL